jgi:hypothetical protein
MTFLFWNVTIEPPLLSGTIINYSILSQILRVSQIHYPSLHFITADAKKNLEIFKTM